MNFGKNASIAFLVGMGQAIVGILAFAILSQLLGVSGYGVYLLFFGVVVILSAAADLGIDNAVQKQVSQDGSLQDHAQSYTAGFLLKLLLVAVITGLILLFRSNLNAYLGMELALNLIPSFIIYQINRFQLKMLHGELRVGLAKMIEAFQRILFVFFAILLVVEGFGTVSLTWSLIASQLIGVAATTYYLGIPFKQPDTHHFSILFNFSKYDSVSSILGGTIYSWLDTIAIGYFLDPTFVTIYEGAWRIGGGIMLLSQAIGTTIFPHVSNWEEKGDIVNIEETSRTAITWSLFLVFPAIVGSAFIGDDLMAILTGKNLTVAHFALFLILLGKIPEGVNNIIGKVLTGLDRPDLLAKSMALFAIVNISLNVVLTPTFGILGAAAATVAALTICALFNYMYLDDIIDIEFPVKDLFTLTIASIIMGVPVGISKYLLHAPPLTSVGIVMIVGVISYGIVIVIFSPTRDLILRSPATQIKVIRILGKALQDEN